MIRSYDLQMDTEFVNQLLNDPHIVINERKVTCSTESGYTTILFVYEEVKKPVEHRRERKIGRYILFNGFNKQLNDILSLPTTRLIKQYDFTTNQGTIIVIDYEVKKERT